MDRRELVAYNAQIDLLYRLFGGGQPRARTEGGEQREVDLLCASRLLVDLRALLLAMPHQIAAEVGKLLTRQ